MDSVAASRKLSLYASNGREIIHYRVNVTDGSLERRDTLKLQALVQYAWPHASKQFLYVVSTNRLPFDRGGTGSEHYLSALSIDPITGALKPHGESVLLPQRPIHVTTDEHSACALVAYSNPGHLTVHRINSDGTLGAEIEQPQAIDTGIFPHQIRVGPSNNIAILVTRGHDATAEKPEEPGALKVFKYTDGVLSDEVSIEPNKGYGFGPRHLDFHPTKSWIYVSLERQHKICLFTFDHDALSEEPLFEANTLAHCDDVKPGQMAGTIHVHPNGCFVYGVERATEAVDGRQVFRGGENAILAWAIDQRTGEPRLIQRVPTRGLHARTFAIDPTGSLLIAANKSPVEIQNESIRRVVPAGMDVFRVKDDGALDYIRTYEIDVGDASLYWIGLIEH